jgi:hypothetical protein
MTGPRAGAGLLEQTTEARPRWAATLHGCTATKFLR